MPEPRVTRHFVDVGGRQVHYRRLGTGPAVLLVHETPMTGLMLLPLARKLAALGLTAIALDSPGYGVSDRLATPRWPDYPMIADYADALVEVIPALGLERAHVYGSHTGALIALEAGYRHPTRVASVVADGLPVFSRVDAIALDTPRYLAQFPPTQNGTHLLALWQRYRDHLLFWPWYNLRADACLPFGLPAPRWLQDRWLDWVLPGERYGDSYEGAFRYEVDEALLRTRARTALSAHDGDFLKWGMESLPKRLLRRVTYARMPPEEHAPWLRDWLVADPQPDAPAAPEPVALPGRISRTYASDGRRQLLVRRRADAAGVPLVLIPDAPDSGSGLRPLLDELAATRPVVAVDTAGNGGSDRLAAERPALADYVASYGRALRSLGLGQVDLYGKGTGAVIALELARARPGLVRRLVLDGMPLHDPATRRRLARHPRVSLEPESDGTHLQRAWTLVRDSEIFFPWFERTAAARRPLDVPPAGELHRRTLEVLKSLDTYDLAPRAALAHPLERALAAPPVPTLAVAGPRDAAAPVLQEVGRLAGCPVAALPAEPAGAAEVIARFLDGDAKGAVRAAKALAARPGAARYWALP